MAAAEAAVAEAIEGENDMSILKILNPFKKNISDEGQANESKLSSSDKKREERSAHPHDNGGCCGGCGGTQESDA